MTADGRAFDLRQTCPATIRDLARRDIDVMLRRDMAARDPDLKHFNQNQVPWLAPLRELATGTADKQWTKRHQAMLVARAANGLYSPARKVELGVIGLEEGTSVAACKVCGAKCDQVHRDLWCPAR